LNFHIYDIHLLNPYTTVVSHKLGKLKLIFIDVTACLMANWRSILIDLWSEETIYFSLEIGKTSKEIREVYNSTLQVSNMLYLVQLDNSQLLI